MKFLEKLFVWIFHPSLYVPQGGYLQVKDKDGEVLFQVGTSPEDMGMTRIGGVQ